MLEMRAHLPGEWKPGINLTEAISNKGTEELAGEILRHKEFLISSGELEKRRKEKAKLELIDTIESSLLNYIYRGYCKVLNTVFRDVVGNRFVDLCRIGSSFLILSRKM